MARISRSSLCALALAFAHAATAQETGWRPIGEKAAPPALVPVAAQMPTAAVPPPRSAAPLKSVAAPMPFSVPAAAAVPQLAPVPPPAEAKPPAPLPLPLPLAGPALEAPPRDDPAPKRTPLPAKPLALAPTVPAFAAPPTLMGTLPMSAALYRPLARLVAESEADRWPGTPNELLQSVAWPARPAPPPPTLATGGLPQSDTLEMSDLASCGPWWAEPMELRALPAGLLWQPPLADQRAPRMAVRSLRSNGLSAIDTAIGGQWGLYRLAPVRRPEEGLQFDLVAAAFSRFDERRRLAAMDFRAGVPLTYAKGPVSAKFGYEHQSSHLGDERGAALGLTQQRHVRDELVAAAAIEWSRAFRTYAQAAHALHIAGDFTGRNRFGLGAEWNRRLDTRMGGRPFAAVDCEWREDQDYVLNATLQAGWQWRSADTGRSARLFVERHTGDSPYGQFYLTRENWWAFGGSYDW